MPKMYIWTTLTLAAAALLTVWFGWVVMFVAFILPPLTAPLLAVMSYLPMVAITLACGLPAVLARRWPIAAIALLGLGGWIFAQTTFLVPSKSKAAVAAITKAV